jgi:hypothetical protein
MLWGMGRVVYSVIATVPDEQTRAEYLDWLVTEHIGDVVEAGAEKGRALAVLEPATPLQVESQYEFASMEAFERYVAEAAPRLRAEGLRRFGAERGIAFQRRVGEVMGSENSGPGGR